MSLKLSISHYSQHSKILEALSNSEVYREYQDAFVKATGLPITLEAPDEHELKLRTAPAAAPFCALMASAKGSCGAC